MVKESKQCLKSLQSRWKNVNVAIKATIFTIPLLKRAQGVEVSAVCNYGQKNIDKRDIRDNSAVNSLFLF